MLYEVITKRASTTLAFLMMLVMTPLTLYLAVTNPVNDCGCFGDAWVLTNWQTFWKNVVLLVAAASVFAGRARIIRFVTAQTEWLVSLYTVLYILVFSSYCIRNLPVIDFRPYKIGKSITEGMSVITSYSIHYTKLYEAMAFSLALVHELVGEAKMQELIKGMGVKL